jgi:predicted membrane protein
MKIYESRLTWIIGFVIVTSLFFYNYIFLPFGFMWFIKSLICFGCAGFIFWTKLFKEYPKKTLRALPSEVFRNDREEI